jgi:diguanylate cyclase (GGDEF)-like protein/PAS domain S-box-containing protein
VLGSVNEMVVVTTAEPIDRPGPVIVYVNEAFLRLTGFPRSEVLGRSPRFLQAPQADPGSRREFREKLASWQSGRVEIDNYTKDGSKYWVEIDFSPVADDTGWFTNWVSVQTIVTDRRSAQQRLQESETRYRLLAENSSDVIVSYGVGGLIRWVSPSLTVTLGWSAADWVGCRMTDFIHPADVDRVVSDRQRMNTGELPSEHGQWVTRFRVRAANGHYHWIETHARDASGIEGLTDGAVVSFRRVDREVQAELELQRRATYDDLTGAFKRDEALSRLDAASTQVRRRGEELAVLFCDIDLLKDVNDARGHAAGDELLRVVAERIRGAVRVSDTVARMGGDEFLVVLDGLHSLAEAVLLAEQIRTLAAGPVPMPGGSVRATVSVGVTLAAPGEGADAMMARADRAMYLAKQGGRNRVVTLYVDEESGAGAD